MNPVASIRIGHVLAELRRMPAESVHCIPSSPPYYGLRDYDVVPTVWDSDPTCGHDFTESNFCKCGAWFGIHGLEPTIELYVKNEVLIWREARRVLRYDGVLLLNMGDSFAGSWGNMSGDTRGNGTEREIKKGSQVKSRAQSNMKLSRPPTSLPQDGLKDKDMMGLPWTVALALRADGWYLRRDIIWHKPNPMPESAKDRPTTAHEYVFLLTKSEIYFWDWWAIREPVTGNAHPRSAAALEFPAEATRDQNRRRGVNPKAVAGWAKEGKHDALAHAKPGGCYKGSVPGRKNGPGQSRRSKKPRQNPSWSAAVAGPGPEMRNCRSVWTLRDGSSLVKWLATQPDGPALLERFLSETGRMGSVWLIPTRGYEGAHFATFPAEFARTCIRAGSSAQGCCPTCGTPYGRILNEAESDTIGWRKGCQCKAAKPVPCTILDPFAGSGTVGEVSLEESRSAILIDLGPHHKALIEKRCSTTPHLALAL